MTYVGIIVALLLSASSSQADNIQVAGARKYKHAPRPEINIEDMIRAEEDPNFPQYQKERERQKKAEKAAVLAYEKQRQADEEANQKAQQEYLRQEHEKAARKVLKKPKRHDGELKAWKDQQEKYRQEFVAQQNKQMEKFSAERIARMQRVLSVQRMPASTN